MEDRQFTNYSVGLVNHLCLNYHLIWPDYQTHTRPAPDLGHTWARWCSGFDWLWRQGGSQVCLLRRWLAEWGSSRSLGNRCGLLRHILALTEPTWIRQLRTCADPKVWLSRSHTTLFDWQQGTESHTPPTHTPITPLTPALPVSVLSEDNRREWITEDPGTRIYRITTESLCLLVVTGRIHVCKHWLWHQNTYILYICSFSIAAFIQRVVCIWPPPV